MTEAGAEGKSQASAATGASSAGSIADGGDWELQQSIRALQARLGAWHRHDTPLTGIPAPRFMSSEAAHRRAQRSRTTSRRKRHGGKEGHRSAWLAWTVLLPALTAFACGAALLVWATWTGRDELWTLGLPIVIGGQVGLVLGVILQLERIWQNSQHTVRKLQEVDAQLHHMERSAHLLNATHGTASQAFHSHLAADANPSILLADLKGQLDMLTEALARRG